MTDSDDNVAVLCRQIMQAVVNSDVVSELNIDRAVVVIRAEIKALLVDDEYAIDRELILTVPGHERELMATVVAAIVRKIEEG